MADIRRLCREWGGLRAQAAQNWLRKWIPAELSGAVQGRTTTDIYYPHALLLQVSREFETPLCGCNLDYAKAYDRLPTALWAGALQTAGMPAPYVELMTAMHTAPRHFALLGYATAPILPRNRPLQCRPLAPTATNLIVPIQPPPPRNH